MKKKYCLLFTLLCFSWTVFSQTYLSIRENYQKHFKHSEQEAVYIHLNKTSYLVGEEIWFKGYIFSQRDEKSSQKSTNLYVGLYDANGIQISKKLVHIQNGVAAGNLELDKELSSGRYYIKAATQYMIDTKSKNVFIEEITLYGTKAAAETQKDKTKNYDIQFLPEGGHLVNNIENTIAYKAINQEGKGVFARGTIYDENNQKVTTFESNTYGIGTFQFTPKNNSSYTVDTTFEEEKTTKQTLPNAKNTGINIQVNNMETDSVKVALGTNKETLRAIVSKEYTLLIHKDGKARSMPFSFKDTEEVVLTIARKGLFNGVNTITLFDGKIPVLERLFFNRKTPKNLSVVVKKGDTEKEYSNFSLYLIKRRKGILEANVSISVLPETTEAYNPAHNIYSSFYLKPYVRGEIENPKYYFPNTTKTKRKALDDLLISQGWSAYDWTAIFQEARKNQEIERGITINGTVNFPVKRVKGVFLHDSKKHPARFIPIDKDRKFVIKDLFPQAEEELRFSVVDFNKKFLEPKLYLTYSASAEKDQISENARIDRSFLNKNEIFTLPNGFFPKDAEALDAVLLKGENNKEEENVDPMMVNAKVTKIGVKEYLQYPQVKNIIENSGYDVSDDPFDMQNLRIYTRKRLTLETGDPPGHISPLIFLDEAPLSDFNILRNFSTANVDRVVINKTGQGYGVRGVGGVIKIYTRKTPLTPTAKGRRASYVLYTPPIGFSAAKQYYEPKYRSYTSDTYQKFAAIDWKPNITIPRRGPFNFIVKHKEVKAITMFIEGISKDGSLISEKRIIVLEEDE
ncbi:hypothetical protein KORDIASMS9_00454 [Kordia sp. SMS9]|uniref:hypothetical protein n=1 Tax=Kordia sp. SMS9 TaxID=2282170 RepID=UPI000E0CDB33|nr:hypothetical protein [Kordia sp. SMS9]AXG68261.1 hypothetical protein KORDIASMS9_00454 [Kordia sp. SMS9]